MYKAAALISYVLLLIQSLSAQYTAYPGMAAPLAAAPLASAPCGASWGYAAPAAALAASHGPGLAITSASPVPPVGVTIASENAVEGALALAGAVPFVGSVAVEGLLPTGGAGGISYGCGNGEVAIVAEDVNDLPLAVGPIGYAGPLGCGAPLVY